MIPLHHKSLRDSQAECKSNYIGHIFFLGSREEANSGDHDSDALDAPPDATSSLILGNNPRQCLV